MMYLYVVRYSTQRITYLQFRKRLISDTLLPKSENNMTGIEDYSHSFVF